jgi:hypothetical protein
MEIVGLGLEDHGCAQDRFPMNLLRSAMAVPSGVHFAAGAAGNAAPARERPRPARGLRAGDATDAGARSLASRRIRACSTDQVAHDAVERTLEEGR